MKLSDLFKSAMNDLDEKYINEAAEELYKRQGKEIIVNDNRIAKPQKNSGIKMFLGIAAAIALVVGGFAVLNSLSDKLPVEENPLDSSEIGDKVLKYNLIRLYDESGARTSIFPEIWDEYTQLAAELVENLENVKLTETDYVPSNSGETERIGILLYYDDGCDGYEISNCYSGGALDYTIITKNGVNYKAEGDELIRIMELCAELMKTAVPSLLNGEYYLDGDGGNGVYIEVKNDTICLKGDNDLDFVKANCGDLDYNEVYQALGKKEYVISSITDNPLKLPILTEWKQDSSIHANQYEGKSYYYYVGQSQSGNTIELFGHNFYMELPENMEYEDTFAKGTIRFTELKPVDITSINEIKLPIGDETEAKEYFGRLSGDSTGIDRFGHTVLSEYVFDEENSFCNAMGDSVTPSDFAQLRYILCENGLTTLYTGAYVDVFVGQTGSTQPELMLSTGLGLVFSRTNDENNGYSEFILDDGTVLKLKIGGATLEQDYYTAEWTDEARGLKYKVNARRCSRMAFLNTIVALIYDVDGMGNLTSGDSQLPTNFADYEMDFQIFYDYFRGIWQNNEAVYYVELGWNDDFFDYSNILVGFYKDSKGAYMARHDYNSYVLYFIPEDDRKSMHQYVVNVTDEGLYRPDEIPGTIYTKEWDGRYSLDSGMYGYLGMWEMCITEGIDFDSLHDISFHDENDEYWTRFTGGIDWGKIGVINRYGDNPVLALKFLNSDGVTTQYFLCNFKKNQDGTLTLTETPYRFDISELDMKTSQTENAQRLRKGVENTIASGIGGYYEVADYNIYRVSEDSYYLFRSMGVNQGQWHSCIDIFYYSGEILGYKDYDPVMYSLVQGDYPLYRGNYWLAVGDGYLYYLSEDVVENEFFISCIYEGKEISRYDIGYLDCPWFDRIVHNNDGNIDIVFMGKSGRKWQYRVDYSDPYNPQFVGTTNLTDPENQATLYGDYRFVHDVGEKLDKSDYEEAGDSSSGYTQLMDEMYLITAKDSEKLLLKPMQTLVFTIDDDRGYQHIKDDYASFSYHSDGSTNHLTVGYIVDGTAYELYSGQTDEEWKSFELNSLPTGEYYMYITNYSGYLQYFDFIGIAVT